MTLSILTTLAALLGPLSYLPGLRRMFIGRTADGISQTLCGVGLLSYGTWLGLAVGVSDGFYIVLLTSICLALTQAVLTVRYAPGSVSRMLLWFLAGASSSIVALRWPWLAVLYIAPIDLVWYGRAIRDVVKSVAAKAVSVWGWVMGAAASLAWAIEAFVTGNAPLAFECVLLTCVDIAGVIVTLLVRRRFRRNFSISFVTAAERAEGNV